MRPFAPLRLISALLLTTVIASCGGGDSDPTDPVDTTVGSVAVSPGSATLNSLGATTQLSATATSTSGGSVPGTTFTWTSANGSVATVDGNGLVTAVANGTTTVTAAASGSSASGSANVTVAQTAATIAVTSPAETVTAGQTLQLSATVQDAGGSALASPNLTWSSSDESLATVDATGLVAGLRSGSVVITASQDAASGTSDLTVVRGDFIPTADATLGGTLEVATLTVAAGVTVTLTDDAVIDAEGPVTITGNVSGDCKGLSLNGQADVTISGTFTNACSVTSVDEEPPALVIVGAGTVDLDGATITSSGDITIGNSAAPAAARAPALAGAAGALTISLDGTNIFHVPLDAPSGMDGPLGGPGQAGHDILIQPGDLLFLNGTIIQAQNGGPGGTSMLEEPAVDETMVSRGGDGGRGGGVDVIPIELVSLSLVSVGPVEVQFNAGSGGPGGSSTVTPLWDVEVQILPNTSATGGAGGAGGNNSFFDVAFESDLDGTLRTAPGSGAPGGDAFATGPLSFPPDVVFPPGDPGTTTATGGDGGHAGSAPFGSDFITGTADGGAGGTGTTMAIDGVDGNDMIGGGSPGGDGFGFGGLGGNGFGVPGAPGGDAIVGGGNGGDAAPNCPVIESFGFDGIIRVITDTDLSDPFIFNAGGGIPIILSGENVVEEGGAGFAGGNGGDLMGAPGLGGFDALDPLVFGPDGNLILGPGGNGGAMGRGLLPGTGGMAGSGPSDPFTEVSPIFTDGFESGDVSAWSCATPTVAPAGTAGGVTVTQAVPGTLTLSGTGAWVSVTGPIAEDGTITAEGAGTVAGVQNIAVSFSGTFDEQAGTLVGNYSMDTGSAISPGHPVVYGLDTSRNELVGSWRATSVLVDGVEILVGTSLSLTIILRSNGTYSEAISGDTKQLFCDDTTSCAGTYTYIYTSTDLTFCDPECDEAGQYTISGNTMTYVLVDEDNGVTWTFVFVLDTSGNALVGSWRATSVLVDGLEILVGTSLSITITLRSNGTYSESFSGDTDQLFCEGTTSCAADYTYVYTSTHLTFCDPGCDEAGQYTISGDTMTYVLVDEDQGVTYTFVFVRI